MIFALCIESVAPAAVSGEYINTMANLWHQLKIFCSGGSTKGVAWGVRRPRSLALHISPPECWAEPAHVSNSSLGSLLPGKKWRRRVHATGIQDFAPRTTTLCLPRADGRDFDTFSSACTASVATNKRLSARARIREERANVARAVCVLWREKQRPQHRDQARRLRGGRCLCRGGRASYSRSVLFL